MYRIFVLSVFSIFLLPILSVSQGGSGEPIKKKVTTQKKASPPKSKPNIPVRTAVPNRSPTRLATDETAQLTVRTTPSDSLVMINGEAAGITDEDGMLGLRSLSPGVYSVSVSKEGYLRASKQITISAGRSETLVFELEVGTQVLNITSSPPESEVYIDDVFLGSTDTAGKARFADIAIGEHRVTVRKPRYREFVFPLSLASDKEGQITANLELAVGFLSVTTNVRESSIDIAGIGRFENSVSKVELRPGVHTVTVSCPFYVKSQREVTVTAGQEAELSVTLVVDSAALGRLKASTLNSFSRTADFSTFSTSARQVIDLGGSLEFNLKHHDFVMPGLAILKTGERVHPIKLSISSTSISFDPQVNQEAECSFKKFNIPNETISSVQVEETGGGLFKKVAGVYLKMEITNPTNPKKPYILNFVDSTATVGQDNRGIAVIRSRTEATQALRALSEVIRYARMRTR